MATGEKKNGNGIEKKLANLKGNLEIKEHQMKRTEKELEKSEQDNKSLADQNKKLMKKIKSGVLANREVKIERLAVDSLAIAGSQAVNFGIQSLIDFMAEKFDFVEQHKVAAKTVPPVLSALWYLVEVYGMGQQDKMGKKFRLQASTLLTNLGFVYLGQAFSQDTKGKRADADKTAQDNAALVAKNEKISQELEQARQKLKQAGIGQ